MSTVLEYAREVTNKANKTFRAGEIFAKVLTTNDDSGRHGVLVPLDTYPFFPDFRISDPGRNTTTEFRAFDALANTEVTLGYKYYERYPERRITRLHGLINDRSFEPRLVVFLRARHSDGSTGYYVDCANSKVDGRFNELFRSIFGEAVTPVPGGFVVRPVEAPSFAPDLALTDLLAEFDRVRDKGWVSSLRTGDTGIGYTFETLLGIKENNDRRADFKGIEIKCKAMREGAASASGKINLFQQSPVWLQALSARERIRVIGRCRSNGLYSCYSQITTRTNNLGLSLAILGESRRVDLRKRAEALGYWPFGKLATRLQEKHARAVIIKAATRRKNSGDLFRYEELVYCERPTVDRFLALVRNRNIVFEFLMSEKDDGTVRNRGYPWRLVREEFLEHLFSFQIKLRSRTA